MKEDDEDSKDTGLHIVIPRPLMVKLKVYAAKRSISIKRLMEETIDNLVHGRKQK